MGTVIGLSVAIRFIGAFIYFVLNLQEQRDLS